MCVSASASPTEMNPPRQEIDRTRSLLYNQLQNPIATEGHPDSYRIRIGDCKCEETVDHLTCSSIHPGKHQALQCTLSGSETAWEPGLKAHHFRSPDIFICMKATDLELPKRSTELANYVE